MKRLTALLTSVMLLACIASSPVYAAHTFENTRTDDYCKELLETCSDCYTLDADGVYTYTNCVYHTGRNMFEPYLPEPGTYDRSDLLLSLARIHPESKYLVKIRLNGEVKGEPSRLAENGISIHAANATTFYAVMTAEQVENFPASEKVGYLLSLSRPLEEVLTTEPATEPEVTTEPATKRPTSSEIDTCPDLFFNGTRILEPLKIAVGETIRIHVGDHPTRGKATNVKLGNAKEYLDWEFDAETADLVITAKKPGENLECSVTAAGYAFYAYLHLNITEGSYVEPATVSMTGQIPGDLNGDGVSDIMDVIRLNKVLLGVEPLSDEQNAAADVDGNGEVNSDDALALLKQILGIVKQDPVEKTVKLTESYYGRAKETVEIDNRTILAQTKFALDLLRSSAKTGENTLVCPYSVSQSLGMSANGAVGDTLKEMEQTLGNSMDTLNPAFYTLRQNASQNSSIKFTTANSIWVKSGYPVKSDFLQKNMDYYGADTFAAPFDDATKDDINSWVDENTDHMVPEILDEIPAGVRMYLINAVAFEAEWAKKYPENKVKDREFTAADGKKQDVQMMYGDEYYYLADDHATGFIKSYEGGQYYFAALLPEEGMTPEAYLDTVKAEELNQMLAEPVQTTVETGMPQFSYDFGTLLNEPLQNMGMKLAFDANKADFSGMTDDPEGLYVSRVIHKTHIDVSPLGTRAGAAAAVEMTTEAAVHDPEKTKQVVLDRPFVYMIVEKDTSLPVFVGILNSVS